VEPSSAIASSSTINEFRVGKSIADLVMFNGTSKAFEIKTELDSDQRLSGQLADYTKIFKQCYIVTHEALVDKYLGIDDTIGIIKLIDSPRSLKMEEVRPAKDNLVIDPETLIRSLRTYEYQSIISKYYDTLPDMNSFNMFNICNELMKEMPSEQLSRLFIDQLKERKSNTSIIKIFKKELRQIGIAMNLSDNKYHKLIVKLNQPIRI